MGPIVAGICAFDCARNTIQYVVLKKEADIHPEMRPYRDEARLNALVTAVLSAVSFTFLILSRR